MNLPQFVGEIQRQLDEAFRDTTTEFIRNPNVNPQYYRAFMNTINMCKDMVEVTYDKAKKDAGE